MQYNQCLKNFQSIAKLCEGFYSLTDKFCFGVFNRAVNFLAYNELSNYIIILKKIGLPSYSQLKFGDLSLIKVTFGLKCFEEILYLPKGLNLSNNRSTRLGMFFLKGSDGFLSMGDSSTLGLINLSRWAQVWFSPEAYFT